ncbi:unnamed protein product [Eretmochelys imbricata]
MFLTPKCQSFVFLQARKLFLSVLRSIVLSWESASSSALELQGFYIFSKSEVEETASFLCPTSMALSGRGSVVTRACAQGKTRGRSTRATVGTCQSASSKDTASVLNSLLWKPHPPPEIAAITSVGCTS